MYPVVSRRSRGLSIGVNLNPDKACNFDCIYCQVDRNVPGVVRRVDLPTLSQELDLVLGLATGGRLFDDPKFAGTPQALRRINDIAFSGDGEPTTCPQFAEAVQLAAETKQKHGVSDAKIILITDACYLTRPSVVEGLAVMDIHNGEIWAKLDAGTEEYYRLINRPNYPLSYVLENITAAARVRPICIQSLWMRVHDRPPPEAEIEAFTRRLGQIIDAGGRIRQVQVYTVARGPAEPYVSALSSDELERIAATVRAGSGLTVDVFPAST